MEKKPASKHGEKPSKPGRVAEAALAYASAKGVVSSFVPPSAAAKSAKVIPFKPATLIEKVEEGLPVQELEALQASLDLPMDRLAPLLGISKATLHRRKASGRLDATESDRVVRFARLMGMAVRVLESEENARLWLNAPQIGLGGAAPLAYARTEVGAREVEDLLGRIEYGVYS